MQCPNCQHENREDRRFCGECRTALPVQCPGCAFVNDAADKYCGGCSEPLSSPVASASSAPAATHRVPSPQEYTPQHLAARILALRGALVGDRKQVTVLFADLTGSTALIAGLDPEAARALQDPVLHTMMDAVHRFEGTVNQVLGDGILALFGAPLAHEDHAVRACFAALHMQEAMRQHAASVLRRDGVRLQIRVGLNSGEVVVRSLDSSLYMEYLPVGETVNLAKRMEETALPGTIQLAPDTLRLVEGYVQVRALGPIPVKGSSEPVEVHELVGAAPTRSRLHAAAARGLTRFVGRDAELAALRRALEQAGAGHGQIVALVGEPGVGKSRLVWELTHSRHAQGWLVLEGGAVSYGQATAYLPIIELLRGYCGIDDRDDARRGQEKLTGKLLTLDPALQPTLSPLRALLDLPIDDPPWEALDPAQRRQRTLDAVKRLVLRESREQPLLLVLEDLHWSDAETQALLDNLVDSLPTARVLLVANYRPEYEHGWHRRTYYQQLRLDPLPPDSANELLAALLGEAADFQPLKRVLIERTEGNPFFVEESVRALVESGVLAGERGAYRLTGRFESAQVPATVQAVLAARIDRLAPEDKRLLQAASVIGKDVPYPLLQAIADQPESTVRERLARLQAAELLYEMSLFPELEYTFKHALTHDVAYASLLQERRRALHAQVVEAIEALYPHRLSEQVARLGHHSLRGELWDKAATYLQAAGMKAAERAAYHEAVVFFEQALLAIGHLPDGPDARGRAIDVQVELYNGSVSTGQRSIHNAVSELRQVEASAAAAGDQRRLGRVSAVLALSLWNSGDFDGALESGERTLTIATALDDLALQVRSRQYLAQASYHLGDYRRVIDLLTLNVSRLRGDLLHATFDFHYPPAALSCAWMAASYAEIGEFPRAVAAAEEAIAIAQAVDSPFGLAVACRQSGHVYLNQGDWAAAMLVLERAVEICRARPIPLLFSVTASRLGHAYALAGRYPDAVALLEEALAQGASIGRGDEESSTLAWLGEALLRAGRLGEALDCARRALAVARERMARGHEAYARWLLAESALLAAGPEVVEAEAHYHEALALANALGMRPLEGHCHLGLGTLHHTIGRDEQARVHLATAAELYRAMDMRYWLAQAEAAIAQCGPVAQ